MEKNISLGDTIDLYCVDCKRWTKQKYINILSNGSRLFLCKDCGCENIIDRQDEEDINDYERLLLQKGFALNEYPEGKFWELQVTKDQLLKERICKIFGADIDMFVNGTDIDTLILQCAEDFTKCLFYYDCNPFDMNTEEFMECVSEI